MAIKPNKYVFDSSALWYQSYYAYRDLREITSGIIKLLEIDSQDTVIDFGCGVGDVSAAISRECRQIVGYDISPNMVACAKKNYPHLAFYSDKSDFPYRNFNKGFSFFHVANYVFAQEGILGFLSEVSKLTRPGGRFIFDFWNARAVAIYGLETREKTFVLDNNSFRRQVVPKLVGEDLVKIEISISEYHSGDVLQCEDHYLFVPSEEEIYDAARVLGLKLSFRNWPNDAEVITPWTRVGVLDL